MRTLLSLLALLAPLVLLAQPRNNAGYECEEELFPRYDKATRTYGYVNMVGAWRVDPTFTKAQRFSGKLAVVQQGTKFGLINCQGRLAAPAVFDQIENFVNGRGWARQGNLWGILDDKGKLVVPPAFEDIRPVGPRNELTWVKKKGVWGVFNKETTKMEVEPKYEACRSISDSLGLGMRSGYISAIYLGDAQVVYDSCTLFEKAGGNTYRFQYHGKYGLFEATGNVLMRPEYDSLNIYTNYLLCHKNGRWAIASVQGKLLTGLDYTSAKGSDGLIVALKKDGKWGYLLASGKPYLPFNYVSASADKEGYYAIERSQPDNKWALGSVKSTLKDSDFKYRFIEFYEDLAVELTYPDSTTELMSIKTGQKYPERYDGWARQVDSNRHLYLSLSKYDIKNADYHSSSARHNVGFVDLRNFNRYIKISDSLNPICWYKGYTTVTKKGETGLIDLDTKKLIIPYQYDRVSPIVGTLLFQAQEGDKVSVYNQTGKILYTFSGTNLNLYKGHIYRYRKYESDMKKNGLGLAGLIEAPDKILVKPTYDKLDVAATLPEGSSLPLIAKKKDKVWLIDSKGNELTEPQDSIRYVGEGYFTAVSKGNHKLITKAGKEAQQTTYDAVYTFSDGLLLSFANGKFSYLNRSLKPAFNLELERADSFKEGTARVTVRGHNYRINKQGKIVQILP